MGKYLDLFIKNIEKRRDGRPMTWLSVTTGVPINTLRKYISKDREPGLEILGRIADGLECTIGDLLGEPDKSDEYLRKKVLEQLHTIDLLTTEVARLQTLLSEQAKAPGTIAEAEIRAQKVIEKSRAARGLAPKSKKKS